MTRWKAVETSSSWIVGAQVNGAAEDARLARQVAHLDVALDQREASPQVAGAVGVDIDVVLQPAIELTFDFVGCPEGSDHVAAHDLEQVGNGPRTASN